MRRVAVALAACGGSPRPTPPPPPIAHAPADAAVDAADPCAYLDQATADYEARMKDFVGACSDNPQGCMGGDYPGPPTCSATPLAIDDRAAPWTGGLVVCQSGDSIYSDPECELTIDAGGATIGISHGLELRRLHPLAVTGARVVDLIAGGAPELVVQFHADTADGTDRVVVCRAEPELACSEPIATSGIDDNGVPWTTALRIDGRHLVLERADGEPPPPPDAIGRRDPKY